MRYTNQRAYEIHHDRRNDGKFECKDHWNYRLQSQKYYMHYNNGIYMGGMISYKRNGQGIILLDHGTSAVTNYCYDTMVGHNIIFRDDQIISILYTKNNEYEIVYKTGTYIIKIPYYDGTNPNGNGVLVDFANKHIYHLIYQDGIIIKKITQTNKHIIHAVFSNSLDKILDIRHEKAFKFNLKFDNGIKIIKENKKMIIGFIDQRNQLEGIGFKLKVSDDYDNFDVPFVSKCIQRGHYRKNMLEDYGQRYFPNGNLYIGQFQSDIFSNRGILIYPQELKWAFGLFQNGELSKMIAMNTGQNEKKSAINLKKCLKEIHQYNTKNWMNTDVQLISSQLLLDRLDQAVEKNITAVAVQTQRQRKQEKARLNKIQEFFLVDQKNKWIDNTLVEQMVKQKSRPQLVTLNQKGSLKPLTIKIEQKNTSNSKYWASISPKFSPTKNNKFNKLQNYSTMTPKSKKSNNFFEKTYQSKKNNYLYSTDSKNTQKGKEERNDIRSEYMGQFDQDQ